MSLSFPIDSIQQNPIRLYLTTYCESINYEMSLAYEDEWRTKRWLPSPVVLTGLCGTAEGERQIETDSDTKEVKCKIQYTPVTTPTSMRCCHSRERSGKIPVAVKEGMVHTKYVTTHDNLLICLNSFPIPLRRSSLIFV